MSPPDTSRILICEDSPTYAEGLTRFLEHDSDLEVVARCRTGEQALERLPEVHPDLVIMDIELPGMNGVEATRQLMAKRPVPVLVLSAQHGRGTQLTFAALAAGAIDARPKSELDLRHPTGARGIAFRRYVKRIALAGRRMPRRPRRSEPAATHSQRSPSVIGVAASTGGPPALRDVFSPLPTDFAIPILVVQHIASGFLDGLIAWLDGQVAIRVRPARDGATAEPGVWIAPEGAHLVLEEGLVTRLDRRTVSGYHRPAADVLFASLASTAGSDSVAVVLTGMGSDGAEGAAAVRNCGGLTIAQDKSSSVVYGMPAAAAALGVGRVLALTEIGPALARLPARHGTE